jgi:dynein heavy chain
MCDANVPKFLKDDIPLFYAIVQDLFPSSVLSETDNSEIFK